MNIHFRATNEFPMWYDTIITIKVDRRLSDLFQGTHSETFEKVKKSLSPSPLLKLKACFFRQVDVVPPQPVAAKVTVLFVAVHLNLRSVTIVHSLTEVNAWGCKWLQMRANSTVWLLFSFFRNMFGVGKRWAIEKVNFTLSVWLPVVRICM